jgi:FkbM family methyltransferase
MNHFYDVGAAGGEAFDSYLWRAPFAGWAVWCFEPSPRKWPALVAKAETVAEKYQVHLCPFALGGTTETARLWEKTEWFGDSLAECTASDHWTENLACAFEIRVPVVRISDFILQNTAPADRIVLKLDAEGAEFPILDDLLGCPAALARVSNILVEFHTVIPSPPRTKETLSALFSTIGRPLEPWLF